jgi:serine protease
MDEGNFRGLPEFASEAPTMRASPLITLLCLAGLALPAGASAHHHATGPIAHIAGAVPDDPGRGTGWQDIQWNFAGPWGVNAQQAWNNVATAGRPGGKGVIVAVLDTGVAYANRGKYKRSPDLKAGSFVQGYDFVNHDPYADDPQGHGTHVASTIAETTDNGIGLTGLAFGARIMPVRVLDRNGTGNASTIADGVRFAARHGAKVINLSLEFGAEVTGASIPKLIKAIRYAHRRGAVVVGAAGNEAYGSIAYPARATYVVSVSATTEHGCLAEYANQGRGLDLVAPGGGGDAELPDDPNCAPESPAGREISQVTYVNTRRRFGISREEGTSMAVPHVSAIAALIIASGVIGATPTPQAIQDRLEATARDLGAAGYDEYYGWGLVDAAVATTPGGLLAPTSSG